jgi:hypothetical protein
MGQRGDTYNKEWKKQRVVFGHTIKVSELDGNVVGRNTAHILGCTVLVFSDGSDYVRLLPFSEFRNHKTYLSTLNSSYLYGTHTGDFAIAKSPVANSLVPFASRCTSFSTSYPVSFLS